MINFNSGSFAEIVLIISFIGILILLYSWQRNKDDSFDLRDLLINPDTGKIGLFKVGQLISLAISTWIIVYQTLNSSLTDWLFTGYMVSWAGASLVNKALDIKKDIK
jgi:multisubunit Na+/H+ antiporter MnhB subunit